MTRAFMTMTCAGILLMSTADMRAASISGSATIFQDYFAGATDSGGGDAGVTYISPRALSTTDRNASFLGRLDSDAANKTGFMQLNATASFNARYVVSFVYLDGLAGGQETLDIKLGSTSVQSFSAASGTSPWVLTPLASPVTASSLRVDVTEFVHNTGASYIAGTNETLVVSDNMAHIALADADLTASGDAGGAEKANAVDLDGRTVTIITAGSGGERWLEFDLNGTRKLRGLVATLRFNNRSMDLQQPDGLGGWTTFATYTTGDDQNDFAAIRIDDSIAAMDKFRLHFGNAADFRLSDLLLFETVEDVVVPEPAVLGMLSLSALLTMRRRSSSRRRAEVV